MNKLNIGDKVKVIRPNTNYSDYGVIGKITRIEEMGGEIYYTATYHVNCPDGGEGYDNTAQFKEAEYELVEKATI